MLAEWHIVPEYIIEHWTNEEFNLMVEKLVSRKEREVAALESRTGTTPKSEVPDDQFFSMVGAKHRKETHGDISR